MMDDLSITDSRLTYALDELGVIDKWLGGSRTSINALAPFLHADAGPARVLDVGAGGGDFLATLVQWGSRRGMTVEAVGVDVNTATVAYAQRLLDARLTPAERGRVNIMQGNARALPVEADTFTVAHAALFLHHFGDDDIVALLREMRRVARTVVINDLHRHPFAYYSIALLTQVLSRTPMVKADAPHSVLRGFHRDELIRLATAAGLKPRVTWHWAFRWILVAS